MTGSLALMGMSSLFNVYMYMWQSCVMRRGNPGIVMLGLPRSFIFSCAVANHVRAVVSALARVVSRKEGRSLSCVTVRSSPSHQTVMNSPPE
jgi:hypothetical protein